MQVLVDTCVWSLALRRQNNKNAHAESLINLIDENRVKMIGPIRQELLSGIREQAQFNRLKKTLSVFPDIDIQTADYEQAAEFSNKVRSKGIQGSGIDYLICAVACRHQFAIYTIDEDFKFFQKVIPIKLFAV